MTHMQTLLMWDSATKTSHNKHDAFQDPFERPEWQPLYAMGQYASGPFAQTLTPTFQTKTIH